MNGIAVWNIKLPQKGKQRRIMMTSEGEHRLAAKHMGYTWEAFQNLPGDPRWCSDGQDSQCAVVAMYQADLTLESLKWID